MFDHSVLILRFIHRVTYYKFKERQPKVINLLVAKSFYSSLDSIVSTEFHVKNLCDFKNIISGDLFIGGS